MRSHRGTCVLGPLVAMGLLGMTVGAQGQGLTGEDPSIPLAPRASSAPPRTFGTASESVLLVSAWDFEPGFSIQSFEATSDPNTGIGRYVTVTTGISMVAGVRLPDGALLTRIELEACDTSNFGQVVFAISKGNSPAGSLANIAGPAGTGATETPGCGFFPLDITPDVTVDNRNAYLTLYVTNSSFDGSTRWHNIRVFYRLQVSPAPAVASFGDVPPAHPFFRYVEALRASGITGGCQANPPLFCPDAPLTRGQMATFLSIALGLHFAP